MRNNLVLLCRWSAKFPAEINTHLKIKVRKCSVKHFYGVKISRTVHVSLLFTLKALWHEFYREKLFQSGQSHKIKMCWKTPECAFLRKRTLEVCPVVQFRVARERERESRACSRCQCVRCSLPTEKSKNQSDLSTPRHARVITSY